MYPFGMFILVALLCLLGVAKATLHVSSAGESGPVISGSCPLNSTTASGGITGRGSTPAAGEGWRNTTFPVCWNGTDGTDGTNLVLFGNLKEPLANPIRDLVDGEHPPSIDKARGPFIAQLLDSIPACAHDCIRYSMWSFGIWVDDNRFPNFCVKKKHENSWAATGPCIRDACIVAERNATSDASYRGAKDAIEQACSRWSVVDDKERAEGAKVAAILFPARAARHGAPSFGATVAIGVLTLLSIGVGL